MNKAKIWLKGLILIAFLVCHAVVAWAFIEKSVDPVHFFMYLAVMLAIEAKD